MMQVSKNTNQFRRIFFRHVLTAGIRCIISVSYNEKKNSVELKNFIYILELEMKVRFWTFLKFGETKFSEILIIFFYSKKLLWLKSETFPPFFFRYQSAAERRQEPLDSGFKDKE